jgi:hypothetical protein
LPIETRSLTSSLAATDRRFAFCLADSIGSAADFRFDRRIPAENWKIRSNPMAISLF